MNRQLITTLLMSTMMFFWSCANADEWTSYFKITAIEPHTEYQGGSIRIRPMASVNPANCTNATNYDFMFTVGTTEERAAVISAIYLAYTTGKQLRLYVDSDQCSPANAPIFRGVMIED